MSSLHNALPSKRKAIVVFRSAALGDFILACPALCMVRKTWPDAHVILLTMQSSIASIKASVAKYSPGVPLPWVEFARPHLIDEVRLLDDFTSLKGMLKLRHELHAADVHQGVLLIDPGAPWLGRFKKLALLKFLLGNVPLAGWRHPASLNGDRLKLKAQGQLPHHVRGLMQFLSELKPSCSYRDDDICFDLRVAPASAKWAKDWLREYCLGDKLLVAVAPGSIQPHKRWPLAKFVELCKVLLNEYSAAYIIVIGTPSDRALGDEMVRHLGKRTLNMAGQTSVNQLAALLSNCELVVGNDGGSMHLGDALGCKVVSIVPGIQFPDSIEPWNNRKFAVRHDVPCAPCYSTMVCPLGHNKCMLDLPVKNVLNNCRALLSEHAIHMKVRQ